WKLKRLQAIEESMLELTEDYRAAQDGLGIAHRNPGEVKKEIIEYLWSKLNRSATELERLEKEHQELLEMNLPDLIVAYMHAGEEKPRWGLSMF
ncbi:MAG: hypothetical protein V3U06_10835, partial [Candidatus Binatia bacterium]